MKCMKHYLIRVYGRVQGVGFRYFTERLALKYQIKGTVKNVEDYVEVHAQGDDARHLNLLHKESLMAPPRLHVLKLIQ